jgi:hypothetical protein
MSSCQIPGTGTFPRISSTTARAVAPFVRTGTASSFTPFPARARRVVGHIMRWTISNSSGYSLTEKAARSCFLHFGRSISTDSFQGFERYDTEFPSPSAHIWHKSIPYLYEDLRSSLFGSILESRYTALCPHHVWSQADGQVYPPVQSPGGSSDGLFFTLLRKLSG